MDFSNKTEAELSRQAKTEFVVKSASEEPWTLALAVLFLAGGGAFGIHVGLQETNLIALLSGVFLIGFLVVCAIVFPFRYGFKIEVKGQNISYKKNWFSHVEEFTIGDITDIKTKTTTATVEDGEDMHQVTITTNWATFRINSNMYYFEKFMEHVTSNVRSEVFDTSESENSNDEPPVVKWPKRTVFVAVAGASVPVLFSLPWAVIRTVDLIREVIDPIYWLLNVAPFAVFSFALLNVIRIFGYRVEMTDSELVVKQGWFLKTERYPLKKIVYVKIERPWQSSKSKYSITLESREKFITLTAKMHGFENFVEHVKATTPEKIKPGTPIE